MFFFPAHFTASFVLVSLFDYENDLFKHLYSEPETTFYPIDCYLLQYLNIVFKE